MARHLLIGLDILFICACAVFAIEYDCKIHTFNVTGNHMQFVKEVANAEYAINGMFKGLHCCAKGYRSIEWLKDDQPYPWQSSSSGLILYPESANQTIYTQRVTPEDAGKYTCIVRNDTDHYVHTITLKVYDKAPDEPQLTYVSQDQEVSVGHSLRLFCEAFVGALDHLPDDAYNDAYWAKILPNGTEVRDTKNAKKISRESEQTAGAYLTIEEVFPEHFGSYVCVIKKPGKDIRQYVRVEPRVIVEYLSPNPVPWKQLLFFTLAISMLCLTLFILNRRFGLKLRVKLKDRFGNLEHNDGKTVDVLIAYTAPDTLFTLETLLPTLEHKFNYVCSSRELPCNISSWPTYLLDSAKKSRRVLAVLSPEGVQGQWDTPTLYEALKQFSSLNAQFTCIMMAEVPKNSIETKNDLGETFMSLYRQVRHVLWTGPENAERFWLSLRLHLPPKQCYSDMQSLDMTLSNVKRLNQNETEDSLDGLV